MKDRFSPGAAARRRSLLPGNPLWPDPGDQPRRLDAQRVGEVEEDIHGWMSAFHRLDFASTTGTSRVTLGSFSPFQSGALSIILTLVAPSGIRTISLKV